MLRLLCTHAGRSPWHAACPTAHGALPTPACIPPHQAGGDNATALTVPLPAENFNWAHAAGVWEGVTAVVVQSAAAFSLTELAVQSGECQHWAQVDMGDTHSVGLLR